MCLDILEKEEVITYRERDRDLLMRIRSGEYQRANATSLAMMFNVKPLTIRRYIQSNGLSIQFQVGHSMCSKQREAWEEFLRNGSVAIQETGMDNSVLYGADTDTMQCKKMHMRRFSLNFEGDINVSAISNSLIQILGGEAKGEVEIVCNLL